MEEKQRCRGCNQVALGCDESKKTQICTDCRKNSYGGERAVCPDCGYPQDKSLEFDVKDWRQLECTHCHKSAYYTWYFPKSIRKAKEDYDNSTNKEVR